MKVAAPVSRSMRESASAQFLFFKSEGLFSNWPATSLEMMMKRRILLVDDEVTVLLTLKAVLEINGFDVSTAASAREARSKIRAKEYHMIISDMRMENDAAGAEVVQAARTAPYHPAVALLTAFPVDEESWDLGAPDKVLVKATQTRVLLDQIETLFASHAAKLARLSQQAAGLGGAAAEKKPSATDGITLAAAEGAAPKRKTTSRRAEA